MKQKLEGLCDIHSHIIFGMDDGSKDEKMSIAMLRTAAEEGISEIILTPHYNPARWPFRKNELRKRMNWLQGICKKREIDIRLHLGCEVYWSSEAGADIEAGKIQTMADSDYVLVEFHPGVSYQTMREAVQTVLQAGRNPIVAHVERYECTLTEPDRIEELRELGALIQVNAGSVTGQFGADAKKVTKQLLKWQAVDFIATDAHRDSGRAPYIQECAAYVMKKYGKDYADRIFRENPAHIIRNEEIEE